jgi:hypothetical protein
MDTEERNSFRYLNDLGRLAFEPEVSTVVEVAQFEVQMLCFSFQPHRTHNELNLRIQQGTSSLSLNLERMT